MSYRFRIGNLSSYPIGKIWEKISHDLNEIKWKLCIQEDHGARHKPGPVPSVPGVSVQRPAGDQRAIHGAAGGHDGSQRQIRGQILFVCLGLTSLFNIWGHIATVPACSSGSLTIVLPHRNAMPQTQDTTPDAVTVYRHRDDLSLCYPLMWNVTLEYTATHFMSWVRPDREILPRPSTHTNKRSNLWCCYGGSQSEVPYQLSLEPRTCGVQIHYNIRSPTAAS